MHRKKQKEVKITLDFETYYDSDYSLRKMTTIEYIRDPRFEAHMVSWRSRDLGVVTPKRAIGMPAMYAFVAMMQKLQRLGFGVRIVGHNLSFDALVLREHFGFETPYYFDSSLLPVLKYGNRLRDMKLETLASMLDLTVEPSLKLEAQTALGLSDFEMDGKKLSTVLAQVKGKRLADIPPNLLKAYAAYCDVDVLLTDGVYDHIAPMISDHALYVQDMHIHALVTMPLRVDVPLLQSMRDDYLDTRDAEINAFAEACGVEFDGLKSIRSKPKFAALLQSMGVPDSALPRKPNAKGEQIYAFATNDLALDSLPDQFPDIDLLGEAVRLRLTYNSTAVESKLKRFAAAGNTSTRHDWAFHVKPFGARNTARHSGGSATGASPQNMSRAKPALPDDSGVPFRKASDISVRDTIMAQEGKELCVADLSGIELRTCMWWCNDLTAMAILSDPTRDLYTEDGRVYFNKPDMTKKDKDLRQASKVVDLSCLARDTEVLTSDGWIPIQDVRAATLVWDGLEWVACSGSKLMGLKTTIQLNGVHLTPDHKVLSYDGWTSAEDARPISVERYAKRHIPDNQYSFVQHKRAHRNVSRAGVGVQDPETLVEVYDVLNCGRRSRFMVRPAGGGSPMLVHNCQYAVGWRKILHQAKLWGIPMTAETAQQLHKMYRVRHPTVVERWAELEKFMRDLAQGFKFEYPLYPCNMTHRGIEMPNGFLLRYPHIQYDYRERRFSYWNASKRCRINVHFGAIVENCSQAGAAAVFNDVLERTNERVTQTFEGAQFVGDVHDEMLFSCNEGDGAEVLKIMLEEMARPIPWWNGLVTFGEGDHGFANLERFDGTIDRASRYGCLK
ncbi:MAG: hypothetical protein ACKO0Z_02295 [Betaproteobacteria bacterium]